MKTLLLVDGSSYLYRAFHALPDLRSPEGFPTGAIRGVLSMLRRLQNDYKADYRAVIFDAKGKTFREDWFPEYKAHRPPMPEDLACQIEPLHEAIAAEGWPLVMIEGVEADDVIGTLSVQATGLGWQTVISTGDKDLAQLVNTSVTLINTMTDEKLDEAGVLAKFGVPPNRIVDYLTLIGDTVDNVPGVVKCGPKTAVKWLTEYGSLDNVVANADKISGVVGQNLRNHLPFIPLGKQLVTVRCDVPLPEPVTTFLPRFPDSPALHALYTRFGFRRWLDEPGSDTHPRVAPPPFPEDETRQREPSAHTPDHASYECLVDWETFTLWRTRIEQAPLVALDTETSSLDPFAARIIGISLAVQENEERVRACYIPLGHNYPGAPEQMDRDTVLKALQPWLESTTALKVGQNIKYDQHVLANHGITLAGIAHDTLLQSYVLEAGLHTGGGHDLDRMAARHLDWETIPYSAVCGKGAREIPFEQVDIERATTYAAEDADVTLRLHHTLFPRIAADPGLRRIYEDFELPAREVIFRMERNGIQIDSARLNAQSHTLGLQLIALEQEAYALAGQPFNLASPKQLAEILFDRLGMPVKKKTPGGAPSTDEEVLSELALDYPLPKCLLEVRQLSKLKSTYTDKLPRMVNPGTGRVHTHFSQTTAVTGRLASSDPNLQNIPVRSEAGRRIRTAFVAAPGARLLSADYSQIELRIMAHLSGDEGLLKAFLEGSDVHRATAGEIFGVNPDAVDAEQRRVAKSINFGLMYGMSAFGLAKQLGLERGAAQRYIERYFARYPGVARYMEETRAQAREQGYVETVFGRRLWLPEIRSSQGGHRQGAERAAINAPMQGTAADLIKAAMVAVQNWLDVEKRASRLLLQVHDELILEVPIAELAEVHAALPGLMTGVAKLKVPLVVDVGEGDNWDAAH